MWGFVVTLTVAVFCATVVSENTGETYDFIVVGGGLSGCVVASRLSESGKHSVLLLEAGGYPIDDLEIPALSVKYVGDPNFSKVYRTAPNNAGDESIGLGLKFYLTGRTLGGGTSIGGMVFNRGSSFDFDDWSNKVGSGWNYESMLPYFKKSETYLGGFPSARHHGTSGPVTVSRPHYVPGLGTWLDAGRSLGYSVADPNGPQKIGFAPLEFSQRKGRRVSSYSAYIKPFEGSRPNLKVVTKAEAKKVCFDGTRAVAVQYMNTETGEKAFALARKEIILSAGAIESPVLLMKSGIGPREVLEASRIPVLKDLPVGKNLQNHAAVTLDFVMSDKVDVFDAKRDLTPRNLELFHTMGDGPYSTYSGITGQAFLASSRSETSLWADIQLISIFSPGVPGLIEKQLDFTPASDEVSVLCLVFVGRPKSRGTITLNPTNVEDQPVLNFKYFSNPADLAVMLEGINQTLRIYENAEPFKRLRSRYPSVQLPACNDLTFRSDEYWTCYINHKTIADLHGSGSCTMGKGPEDPEAVVDPNLKVLGIEGLRVVDASVMQITNANALGATYAVSERASDVILSQYDSQGQDVTEECIRSCAIGCAKREL